MRLFNAVLLFVLCIASAAAQPATNFVSQLEPLRPFLKTWKGHFKNSTPEKPNFDIQKWERALNGRAVRIMHSVNNGSYGGETIIAPNPKTSVLEFHYFTTAGFQTRGTIDFDGKKMTTHEDVAGSEHGITKVKGTTELLANGKMRVITEYYKQGTWEQGRDMTYEESPGAEVKFR
jgi:hypothetical protein